MKNLVKMLVFFFIFLSTTTLQASTTYSLKVNNILYNLESPLIQKNDMLYITADELAEITFGTLTEHKGTYTLSVQGKDVLFAPNKLSFNLEGKSYTFSVSPFILDDKLYIPIELLNSLGYSLKTNSNTQEIFLNIPTPYSRNMDDPQEHHFIDSFYNLERLPAHLLNLSSEEVLQSAITSAVSSKQYISFLDNTNKAKLADFIRTRVTYSPYNNMKVSFRVINTHTYPNTFTDTITLPLKVSFSGDNLILYIGNTRIDSPMYWATFYPSKTLTQMDLHKSFDATLMRALYEYYRNTYGLKDDKYFQPFTLISSDRTNEMVHDAYSLSFKSDDSLTEYESTYTVRVNRIHPSGSIHYIIDVLAE